MKTFILLLFFFLTVTFSQPIISILYFDNLIKEEKYDWMKLGIADILIANLSDLPTIQIVERNRLKTIMSEIELGQSALMGSNVQKQGKLLGAEKLM